MAVLVTVVVTVAYVGCVVAFAVSVARSRPSAPTMLLGLFGAVALWTVVEYGISPILFERLTAMREAAGSLTTAQRMLGHYASVAQDIALMGGGVCGGSLVARLIKHPNMVGPIGAVVALIDTWGVLFQGIVAQLMTNEATAGIAAKAMTDGPKIGAVGAAKREFAVSLPSVGIGDFLFIGLLLCVLVNLKMNWKASSMIMAGAVMGALLLITFVPSVPHLPGLIFIAAGAVLPNLKYFRFTREETFAMLYAGIFVLILTVALYFGITAALPPQPKA